MLNQRQMEILLSMGNEPDVYFTASQFVKEKQVSLRTIQGDIKAIKVELAKEQCAEIRSQTTKGSCLHVYDYEAFSAFIGVLYQKYTNISLNYPNSRVNALILMLLNRHRPIAVYDIEEELFISHSTLINDLKKVAETFEKYQLELLKSNNKIFVDGTEINKRRCLAEKNMYLAHIAAKKGDAYIDDRKILRIKNILTDVLVENGHHIADTEFKNAILFLNIMVQRIQEGFYIHAGEVEEMDNIVEARKISADVFKKLGDAFFFDTPREEIEYFALYLQGQGTIQSADIITEELDQKIQYIFEKIKDAYGFDFSDNINLRISLALHCVPLSIRVKYDMQVKNTMLEYIKKTFPLGYEMATLFAYMLQQEYKNKISDDEISLIALHLYSSLIEQQHSKGNKRVVVISAMKNSMTTLLRQTLFKWFPQHIKSLDFISQQDVTETTLDDYDVFLTTEKGKYFDMGLAMYINAFPNEYDYMNIKLNLDGFKNIDDIIGIFADTLFYSTEDTTKMEMIDILSSKAEVKFGIYGLGDSVMQREAVRSTLFAKAIAVPHPVQSLSSDTFVAVGVSDNPIIWDDDNHEVHLVLMIHVGKNNQRAFQLWNYLSMIFADEEFVKKLLENPTYDFFVELLKEALIVGIQNTDN